MQIVIIALIALAAVALVILPLVRTPRGAGAGDLDPLPRRGDRGDPEPVSPEPRTTPERTMPGPVAPQPPGEADAEELPQAAPAPPGPVQPLGEPADRTSAVAAADVASGVAAPTVSTRSDAGPDVATPVAAGDARSRRKPSPVEDEVLRYREALRAGTVCAECSTANPAGSKFCMECGEKLESPR